VSGECADGGGLVRRAASGGLGAVSDRSGGLAECGLWRRVLDRVGVAAAGGFTFRLFLFFFTLFSILYRAKAGANDENRARRIHSYACVLFSVSYKNPTE